jgi:hypothetical protein
MQVVLKLIQPYTRIRIAFVAHQLNIEERDVEQLLVSLILDGRIQGHIDQARRPTLTLDPSLSGSAPLPLSPRSAPVWPLIPGR